MRVVLCMGTSLYLPIDNAMSATADNAGKPKRKRRWFQFSLRTLLVLVAVVAVWLALTVHSARKQREAVAAIEALGGHVVYEHERIRRFPGLVQGSPQEPPGPGPEWLRELVGEEYFVTVVGVFLHETQITDSGLEHLKGLTSLQELQLDSTKVTDTGLEHLKSLKSLHYLHLDSTNVTDEGVKKLQKALPNCEIFRLDSDYP